MNFIEALDQMEYHGKAVIRTSWKKEDGKVDKYVMLLKGMQSPWAILINPAPNAGNNLFTRDDYRAEDWEVYE